MYKSRYRLVRVGDLPEGKRIWYFRPKVFVRGQVIDTLRQSRIKVGIGHTRFPCKSFFMKADEKVWVKVSITGEDMKEESQKMITLDFTALELKMLALMASREQSRMDILINEYPAIDKEMLLRFSRAKGNWNEIEKKVAEKLKGD